jgi:diguanylate cyclase (GGDEF)-like protein
MLGIETPSEQGPRYVSPETFAGLAEAVGAPSETEEFVRLLPGALTTRRDFVHLTHTLMDDLAQTFGCHAGYYSARGPFEGQVFLSQVGDCEHDQAVRDVYAHATQALERAVVTGLDMSAPGLPFLTDDDDHVVTFVWLTDAFTGAFVLKREMEPFPPGSRGQASLCAAVCAEILGLGSDMARLESETRHDFLTGLLNRSFFERALPAEIERARRSGGGFSLVFMDLDGFKRFNDSFGHRRGDEFLRRVGVTLRESLRAADTATRYGGDEFGLILPDTSADQAATMLTRVKERVEATAGQLGTDGMVSASFGLAFFPADGTTTEQLIAVADSRLYHAKSQNRGMPPQPREGEEPRATT